MKSTHINHPLTPELEAALEAAQIAGDIIMHYYGTGLSVAQKQDQTPVTRADEESEKAIIAHLTGRFPEHGILGEETGETFGEREYLWVIDPIDGTKNYIRNIPFFGTEICLMHRGRPILGVSNMPAIGELLYAQEGFGAFQDGQRLRVSPVSEISAAMMSLGGLNYFLNRGIITPTLNLVNNVGRVRSFGDVYAHHLVATGRCEAVLEASIKLWDIAALAVIITEAGGVCTDLYGKPVGAGINSVLFSNKNIHEQILKYFRYTPLRE